MDGENNLVRLRDPRLFPDIGDRIGTLARTEGDWSVVWWGNVQIWVRTEEMERC